MNSVNLIGNLTKDIELKYTPGGVAVANISIAVNKVYNKDGEKMEEVSYFDIVAWNKTAENCSQYISKGSKIAVSGELRQERWEEEGGNKRSRVKITANRIQFLDSKKKDGPETSSDDGQEQI